MKNDCEIDNVFEGVVLNISAIGPSGKFVEFVPIERTINGRPYKDALLKETCFIKFTSDSLKCEKLSQEKRKKSLQFMLNCLMKHIDEQVKTEMSNKEYEIRMKYYKEYQILKLREKLDGMDSV